MKYLACTLAMALCSCTTIVETTPARTASEQLLVSRAADRAIEQLKLEIAPGTAVYLDTSYLAASYFDAEREVSEYAIGAMREHFAQTGARLVDAKPSADIVVEIRSGAMSFDQRDVLLGIPSIPIPMPISGSAIFSTPEISLYKSHRRTGIAEFAAAAYRADGTLLGTTGSVFGNARLVHTVLLFIITSDKKDYAPKQVLK